MKKLIRSLFFFLLLLILFTVSSLGAISPERISATAGNFQIAPFDNGFALFQNSRGKYYTVSPFNDYELYKDNSRSSFITLEEVENKTFTQDSKRNFLEKKTDSFRDYFGKDRDQITFTSNDKTITYQITVETNRIHIERSVVFETNTEPKTLGMTLSFQGNDFVYDTKSNLYTYIPQEQIDSFNTNFQTSLSANLNFLQIALPDKKVFIINPDLAGVIGIKGQPNQIVRINRDAKFIEVEELVTPVNGIYTSSFDIYLFDSPQEGFMSL